MPPLPLLGVLLDTAGTALKAIRDAGSSASAKSAGNDAASSPAAMPFAQTLKQSVVMATMPQAALPPCRSRRR